LDPISLDQSVAIINENLGQIRGGLKASGNVLAHYTDDAGRPHRQTLDGTLLAIAPKHLRFELAVLGKTQIALGSNDETFWVFTEADETYRWGHHTAIRTSHETRLPIRPDLIADAIGLKPIPYDTRGTMGPVQRIEDEYQQLLFIDYDDRQQGYIQKEYWLERRDRRLVRRIVFRDLTGRELMTSNLDDYRDLADAEAWLPTRIRIRWPQDDGALDFRVSRWQILPQLTTSAPSFALPHEMGIEYRNIRNVDAEWAGLADELTAPPVSP